MKQIKTLILVIINEKEKAMSLYMLFTYRLYFYK